MLSQDRFFYSAPGRVLFGCGARADLAPLLAKLRLGSALVVTDRFFTSASSIVSDLVAGLRRCGIAAMVFDGGAPDPGVELCLRASEWTVDQPGAAGVDHVIALGGGGNIDLAKVLSVTGGLPVARLTKAYPVQPAASAYRQIVQNAYEGVLSSPPLARQHAGSEESTYGTVSGAI